MDAGVDPATCGEVGCIDAGADLATGGKVGCIDAGADLATCGEGRIGIVDGKSTGCWTVGAAVTETA